MTRIVPRVPANEEDLLLTVRDSSSLLETIVRESGDIRPVGELTISAVSESADATRMKINELARCLNTLVAVISGK